MIRSLRSLGKTVLLTTHYLDEAEQLADRVAVLRDGVIVRLGTPRELTTADLEVEIRYRSGGEDVVVRTTEPTRVLNELTGDALARGEELDSLEVRRPTLEQVYLELVDEEKTERSEAPPASVPHGAARLLAQPRGGVLHLHLPAAALPPPRRRLPRALPGRADQVGGDRRARRVRLREHRLRRPRDPARDPARGGDPQADPLDASAAATYVAALLLSTLVVFALQTIALFLLGRVLYGTPLPREFGSLAVTLVIGALVFAALGTATASVIHSAEGSSAVVNFILLPMAFLSGAFGPTTGYPAVLRAIGAVLPLTYFVKLVDAVYLHGQGFWTQPEAIADPRRLGRSRSRVHGVEVPMGATREIEPAVALRVRAHEEPGIEVRINFGVFAGRDGDARGDRRPRDARERARPRVRDRRGGAARVRRRGRGVSPSGRRASASRARRAS